MWMKFVGPALSFRENRIEKLFDEINKSVVCFGDGQIW